VQTRTSHIRLRDWFPPNDPIATTIAILCILREDYFLDMKGLIQGGIFVWPRSQQEMGFPELDENSSGWRRLYFFRNSLRTLREIRKTLDKLYCDPVCRKALENERQNLQIAFAKLRIEMDTAPNLIKNLRDKIGGHVLYPAVKRALDEMSYDLMGFYQDGEIRGKKHYKFTGELILKIMLHVVEDEKQVQELDQILKTTAQLLPAWSTIDDVIDAYIQCRRLKFS